MKKFGIMMMVIGLPMLLYWLFYNPMDPVSRKFSLSEWPSIWFLIAGTLISDIGLVIHSIDSDLR